MRRPLYVARRVRRDAGMWQVECYGPNGTLLYAAHGKDPAEAYRASDRYVAKKAADAQGPTGERP